MMNTYRVSIIACCISLLVLTSSCTETPEKTSALQNVVSTFCLDNFNLVGDGDTKQNPAPYTIIGLNDIADVDAGSYHFMALAENGKVFSWGTNENGILGVGENIDYCTSPMQIQGLPEIRKIATSKNISLALDSEGNVWTWGLILTSGNSSHSYIPVKLDLTNITDISAGNGHCMVLNNNGEVYTWGRNYDGELGIGTYNKSYAPVLVNDISNIVQVSAGPDYSLALSSTGTVYAWGNNRYYQCGQESMSDCVTPQLIHELNDVVKIKAGTAHVICLKSDGTVCSWGLNNYGTLGTEESIYKSSTPIQVSDISNIMDIDTYDYSCIAISQDNLFWQWGKSLYKPTHSNYLMISQINTPNILHELCGSKKIATGNASYIVVKETSRIGY